MRSHVSALFAAFFCVALMTFALPAFCTGLVAFGQVMVGDDSLMPATGSGGGETPNTWNIMLGGSTIATNTSANGWAVSLSNTSSRSGPHNFTITAPSSALVFPNYSINYTTGTPNPDNGNLPSYYGVSSRFNIMPKKPAPAPGPAHTWQGSIDGVNTGNGNKTTSVPLIGWIVRGGMPLSFALTHNSEGGTVIQGCGPKWTLTYDAYIKNITGGVELHWGNGEVDTYMGIGAVGTSTVEPGIDGTLAVGTGTGLSADYGFLTTAHTNYHFLWNTPRNAYLLDRIIDFNNNVITINRNTDGTIKTIVDPTGRALSVGYDTTPRITSLTVGAMSGSTFTALSLHGAPLQWTMEYYQDSTQDLNKIHWPQFSSTDTMDRYIQFVYSNHDITAQRDRKGNVSNFSFNANDTLQWEQDAIGNKTQFAYDATSTTVTDPNGHAIKHTYALQLASTLDAAGKTESMTYNWDNQLLTKFDRRNIQSTWTYGYQYTTATDTNGSPYTYVTGRVGNSSFKDGVGQSTLYVYNAYGKPTSKTEFAPAVGSVPAHNLVTTYTYDGTNNLTSTQSPIEYVSSTQENYATTSIGDYDSTYGYGLPANTTDANVHKTLFHYNGNGNRDEVRDTNNNLTTSIYNALGWMTSSTDGMGHTTTYDYDNWGRLITVTAPPTPGDGQTHVTHTEYDNNGNVTAVKDPSWTSGSTLHEDTTTYDADNRVQTRTNGAGDMLQNTYGDDPQFNGLDNRKGLLAFTTDGNGHVTKYFYSPRNEVIEHNYPLQQAVSGYVAGTTPRLSEYFIYDNDGNLQTKTKRDGKIIQYGYDGDNRVKDIGYFQSDGTTPTGTQPVHFTYDSLGRRTQMTDGSGVTTAWVYDDGSRLTSLTETKGTVTYSYDTGGRQLTRTLAGTGTWTYTYGIGFYGSGNPNTTSGDHLLQVATPADGTTKFTSYDADNRCLTQINGDNSLTYSAYDEAGRQTGETTQTATGGNIGEFDYFYNQNGTVSERDDWDSFGHTSTIFGYDGDDQLTSENRAGTGAYTVGYTYDHNHNRKTKTLNGATENYTYDDADEILTRAVGVTSRTFAFDVNGNQVGNVNYTTHADGSVGSSETDLAYDDADRLTYWHNSSGNKVNQFAYNGLGMRVYKHDMSGDYNYVCDGAEPGSAILTDGAATYTEGLSERRNGVSSYTHPDALGSLRTLTQGQTLVDTLVYDAFGVSEADTNPQATPLKFVGSKGYQLDADSNFELLGHRYYSTATGRFISQDPIKDGDNWYCYVENDPLDKVDPSGESLALALKLAGLGELVGGGPEDPLADALALGGFILGAAGVDIAIDHASNESSSTTTSSTDKAASTASEARSQNVPRRQQMPVREGKPEAKPRRIFNRSPNSKTAQDKARTNGNGPAVHDKARINPRNGNYEPGHWHSTRPNGRGGYERIPDGVHWQYPPFTMGP